MTRMTQIVPLAHISNILSYNPPEGHLRYPRHPRLKNIYAN